MEILNELDEYDKLHIFNSFTEHKYKDGDYIIKQGEENSKL